MLNRIDLRNFGPIRNLQWEDLGPINLVIAKNGSGKSFLLKALYIAMRTLETYKRGNDPRTAADILAEKLYWTFQTEKIGDLVRNGANESLSCAISLDNREFRFAFDRASTDQISTLENHVPPRSSNSLFLPAKEVLSLHQIILKSRDQDRLFGFDDTYLDLARALNQPPTRGKNFSIFANSRVLLEKMIGGRVEYNPGAKLWQFIQGNQRFDMGVTAEGVKKIAILDILLGNRYLDSASVVFIDEPEAALHPKAISDLLDIVVVLAKGGVQFFLATHSYFVVNKLHLIAREQDLSIPVITTEGDEWHTTDMRDSYPNNSIIDESIRLYKEEVELVLR